MAVAIRALAPTAAAVVGMSMGGMTSIALVGAAPELVRRLVLVDITPGVTAEKAKAITDFVNGPASFPSFEELLARTIEHNPTRTEASLRRGILHNAVQLDDGSWEWRYRRFRMPEGPSPERPDYAGLWDILGAVTVPVMLVRGMRPQSVVDDDDEADAARTGPDGAHRARRGGRPQRAGRHAARVGPAPRRLRALTEELLTALAERSPYGALDPPAAALAAGAPLDPPDALIAYVASQLGTDDSMVAASVAFQGVTSRLAAAVLVANDTLGTGIEAPFAAVRWRIDVGVRLGLVELRAGPALPWPAAVRRLVDDAFVPWVACVRRHVHIGERLLWGNAAASLLAANPDRAAETLAALPVAGLAILRPGAAYRRTTCCLIDKAPGYGRCRECSLLRPPTDPR